MFGKYRLTRLLGRGGMGEVYEAYDTEKGRTVALKILAEQHSHDEQFRTRFQRESHAAAILQEPHVIPIHDWGEIDGSLYIDMRLVTGQTLHELLKDGPLQPDRAVAIITQVAAALDAAHAEGLIHRDVKPQNIIVTPADFAYLVDFGIAEAQGDTRLTMVGYHIGSFDYMAPERFSDRPTTPAADVYSLAAVLHQALTGQTPFPAHGLEQVMAAQLTAPPPRPSIINPRVPASFDDVIARGMAKEPGDRYGSAGALGRAAQRALHANTRNPLHTRVPPGPGGVLPAAGPAGAPTRPAGPVAGPPLVRPGRAPERRSRWPAPVIVVVASVLLLSGIGVGAGFLAHQKPGPAYPTETTSPAAEPGYQPPSPPPTSTPSALPSAPVDPEEAARQRLRQLARADRPFVSAELADHWVPQLSSKRPGVVDDGVVWDNARILQEHLALREEYPGVRLLWSGDWSTFSAPDFWVTIVGITFPDSSGALAWCKHRDFDRDHCLAKVVSTTLPIAGSTALN
ncbi:MAG: protein kinase [Mycobacterium sp.]|uniref:serine/threonine-protein kinase n=1 Tax=Mycobacterium sp. TaxID=1785 RepID=UPI0026250DFD|nr:serine/threonine-protein kinase [Mycobacterium sp.]MDI3312735.1 protein kinase [Mycobacterium sp.]